MDNATKPPHRVLDPSTMPLWQWAIASALLVVAAKVIGVLGAGVAMVAFFRFQRTVSFRHAAGLAVVMGIAASSVATMVLQSDWFSGGQDARVRQEQTHAQTRAPDQSGKHFDQDGKPCAQITEFLGECTRPQ